MDKKKAYFKTLDSKCLLLKSYHFLLSRLFRIALQKKKRSNSFKNRILNSKSQGPKISFQEVTVDTKRDIKEGDQGNRR